MSFIRPEAAGGAQALARGDRRGRGAGARAVVGADLARADQVDRLGAGGRRRRRCSGPRSSARGSTAGTAASASSRSTNARSPTSRRSAAGSSRSTGSREVAIGPDRAGLPVWRFRAGGETLSVPDLGRRHRGAVRRAHRAARRRHRGGDPREPGRPETGRDLAAAERQARAPGLPKS